MILFQNQTGLTCFHNGLIRTVVILRVQSLFRMQQWNPKQFGLAPAIADIVTGRVIQNRQGAITLGRGGARRGNVAVIHHHIHMVHHRLGLFRVTGVVPKYLIERLVYGGRGIRIESCCG